MSMNENDDMSCLKVERVPIYQKMTLTIREAAEYSNIGINNYTSPSHLEAPSHLMSLSA